MELAPRVTDAYRAQLLALRARATQLIAAGYELVDLDQLDLSFRTFLARAALTLEAAQRDGISLTDAYWAAYLAAELGPDAKPVPVETRQLAGRGRDGRPLDQVLQPAMFTVAAALGARLGRERALQMGLARLTRTVSNETMAAPRAALDLILEADVERVVGWRRVCSGNACGCCLGAATGAIQKTSQVLKVHGHCRCTKEAVVRGGRHERHWSRSTGQEIFDSKTPAEQDALFHGRGGHAKAQLIRSGDVKLEDLVQDVPMRTVPDEIAETPLAALLG